MREPKQRAARHGVSAEAEHRAIFRHALRGQASSRSFKQALLAMPDVGADRDFERTRDPDRQVDLGALARRSKSARAARAKRSRR